MTTTNEPRGGDGERVVAFPDLGRLGRLGNQMFQIAATVGVAHRNECGWRLPPWPYAKFFAGPWPETPWPEKLRLYAEPDFAYRAVAIPGPTALRGYFQSERYFADCADKVRRLFAPAPSVIAEIDAHFGSILWGKTCSVHVRRGDYVGNKRFVDLAATDYYEAAMARFDADTTFLVFSDDPGWCQQRFRDPRCGFVHGLHDVGDLLLMSRCGGHIVANSSFSWWGAWLDPDPSHRVVAPAAWFAGEFADPSAPFVPGPPHRGFHDARDLVPEHWERL